MRENKNIKIEWNLHFHVKKFLTALMLLSSIVICSWKYSKFLEIATTHRGGIEKNISAIFSTSFYAVHTCKYIKEKENKISHLVLWIYVFLLRYIRGNNFPPTFSLHHNNVHTKNATFSREEMRMKHKKILIFMHF